MASILSHPAVALGLKPWFRRSAFPPRIWWIGAVCTILPDVDVIAFRFGLPYGAMFGHLLLCTASHGVFDAMTSGGLGVAFFAPFSAERYFLPWRSIRVSPLSVSGFFSARGLAILQSELLWVWLPVLVGGLLGARPWARRTKR